MTINITVFGQDFILQASDRCLSYGGVAGTEAEGINKAVAFMSPKVRAMVTYTGIAHDLTFMRIAGEDVRRTTDIWVTEHLCAPEGASWTMGEIAGRLRDAADEWFATFPPYWTERERITIFTLAGYGTDSRGPRGYQIHNCLNDDGTLKPEASDSFAVRRIVAQPVGVAGIREAVTQKHRRAIAKAAAKSSGAVEAAAVHAVRSAAARCALISPDCLTVLLAAQPNNAEARFHPVGSSPRVYGPSVVMCGGPGSLTGVIAGSIADLPEGHSFSLGDVSQRLGVEVARGRRLPAPREQ